MEGVGNILLTSGFWEKSEGEQSLRQEAGGWNRKGWEVGIREQGCRGKQGQSFCGITSGATFTRCPTWISPLGGPEQGQITECPVRLSLVCETLFSQHMNHWEPRTAWFQIYI